MMDLCRANKDIKEMKVREVIEVALAADCLDCKVIWCSPGYIFTERLNIFLLHREHIKRLEAFARFINSSSSLLAFTLLDYEED